MRGYDGRNIHGPCRKFFIPLPALLVMLVTLSVFSTDTCLASFPAIGAHFSLSPQEVHKIFNVYLISFALSVLICGPMANWFGRRKTILVGLFFYALSSWLIPMVTNFGSLLFLRVFQGFGGASTSLVTRVVVRDVSSGEKSLRLFGLLFIAIACVEMVAPVLGGYFQILFGWAGSFWFLGGLSTLYFLLAYVFLEETAASHPTHWKSYGALFQCPKFVLSLPCLCFIWLGFISLMGLTPRIFMGYFQVSPDVFGWMNSFCLGGLIAGSYLSRHISFQWAIRVGIVLSLVGSMGIFFIDSVRVIYCIMPYFFSLGLMLPHFQNRAVSAVAPEHMSYAFATLYAVTMLISSGGSYLANHLDGLGSLGLFLVVNMALLMGTFFLGKRRLHRLDVGYG